MRSIYEETKYILKKYGITANKSLGQNFLINDEVVKKIVESAEISKDDLIIEIGPGLGTLTKELLEKAGKVIAIELDKRMLEILTDRFSLYNNFELINEDVLKVDLNNIIKQNLSQDIQNQTLNLEPQTSSLKLTTLNIKHAKIVANLPYYITTPIVMKLLEEKLPIDSITIMIQKEVADRLIEKPGGKNTGAITYAIYYYATAEEIYKVMPNSFIPEPSVESKVIKLNIRHNNPVKVEDEKLMFKIIKYAFMQRRKTLVNSLENSKLFKSKKDIENMLEKLCIDTKIRGEALSLEDYSNITNFVTKM